MADRVVTYRSEDYAGTLRRLVIDVVDTLIAGVISLVLSLILVALLASGPIAYLAVLVVWPLVWTSYFVVLKRSRFRTVGYIVAGARIVDYTGERPGYLPLLGRLAFVIFGPFNFVADLLWVSSDPSRQALRDKLAHTFVIRRNAVPVGTAALVYRVYMMFGMTLLFPEAQELAGIPAAKI